MAAPERRRIGAVVWAMGAILLVAVFVLWLALSAEPDAVGTAPTLPAPEVQTPAAMPEPNPLKGATPP